LLGNFFSKLLRENVFKILDILSGVRNIILEGV
jgi:hypothetical protein